MIMNFFWLSLFFTYLSLNCCHGQVIGEDDIGLFLYTRNNPDNPAELPLTNFSAIYESPFRFFVRNFFIFHGFWGNYLSEVNTFIRPVLLQAIDANVFYVDYSNFTGFGQDEVLYQFVGQTVATYINQIKENFSLSSEDFTLVGYNDGAHLAGLIGLNLQGQIGSIVGLDPSAQDYSYLNTSSADYVQIIATSWIGITSIANGTAGHSIFYPNGGEFQPGCDEYDSPCHHQKSVEYYAESIYSGGFESVECESYEAFDTGLCDQNYVSYLGRWDLDRNAFGTFFLRTNGDSPYSVPWVSHSNLGLYLYTRQNSVPVQLSLSNFSEIYESPFDSSRRNFFIVHGFYADYLSTVNTHIRPALLQAGDVNVFFVDWSYFAIQNPHDAPGALPFIAGHVARYINQTREDFNLSSEYFTVVGFSYGAQIAGAIGGATGGQIRDLVGLDPVNLAVNRINQTCAEHVQTIATSSVGNSLGLAGHSCFYPNGGTQQPGCNDMYCNQDRAVEYYAESILTGGFTSVVCSTYTLFEAGQCNQNHRSTLGGLLLDQNASGNYYLRTHNDPPYSTVWIDDADLTLYLYTRENPENPFELSFINFTEIYESPFNSSNRNFFVLHGFFNSYLSEVNSVLRPALLQAADVNLFYVDWSEFAFDVPDVIETALPYLARHIANYINQTRTAFGLTSEDYTLVGLGHGAQLAGIAGTAAGGQVKTVIGLDPGELQNPHINQTSGEHVQIIVTSSVGFTSSQQGAVGHSNFFPNGGIAQPGCSLLENYGCNHVRSLQYYAESLLTGGFYSRQCLNHTLYEEGLCDGNHGSYLGRLDPDQSASGSYFLNTNSAPPFSIAPVSGNDLSLYLYTRLNVGLPIQLNLTNFVDIYQSPFDSSKDNYFVVHRFLADYLSEVNSLIRPALLEVEDANLFYLDYSYFSIDNQDNLELFHTAIPYIGGTVASYINQMKSEFGLSSENFNIIGLGEGAHIAGAIGIALGGQVKSIVALDPAPIENAHLNRTCAEYVQVIVTSLSGSTAVSMGAEGQAVFYPNGGVYMPGCETTDTECHHIRAVEYYAESLTSGGFVGFLCNSYGAYQFGYCNQNPRSFLGRINFDRSANGTYFLRTYAESPYSIIWVDPDDLKVHLYTRNNPTDPYILSLPNFSEINQSPFDSSRRNFFILHGFLSEPIGPFTDALLPALLEADDVNIFAVDWSVYALNNTHLAEPALPFIGAHIASYINQIRTTFGKSSDDFSLVGFSYGAQVAGATGAALGAQIRDLVGLDPAPIPVPSHLNRTCAQHVQTIVTSVLGMQSLLNGTDGHSNFYPNGGLLMPGCNEDDISCSHFRAVEYYAESLVSGGFTSVQCGSYEAFEEGLCDQNPTTFLGGLLLDHGADGNYFLRTNAEPPYSADPVPTDPVPTDPVPTDPESSGTTRVHLDVVILLGMLYFGFLML